MEDGVVGFDIVQHAHLTLPVCSLPTLRSREHQNEHILHSGLTHQIVLSLSPSKKCREQQHLAPLHKFFIRGGIRTRDLLLRRQTRYPLRYTDAAVGKRRELVLEYECMMLSAHV